MKEYSIKTFKDIKKIRNQVFYHSVSLKYWKESNIIKDEAFSDCINTMIVTDCSSIKFIGNKAFKGCTNLKLFDGSPLKIGEESFAFCSNLENFNFFQLAALEKSAFEFSGLKEAILSPTIQEIPENCFSGCVQLKKLSMPSVEIIHKNAFDCCAFKVVNLPMSLEKIEPRAFNACFRLTDILCDSPNPPKISTTSFINTPIQNIWFTSKDILEKYKAAAGWEKYSDKMKVIDSVENFKKYLKNLV